MDTACNSSEVQKFHAELQWCIHQLELGLESQSPESRQAQEAIKILKILKSEKAPLVKKRQAMRNALGDYRKKMKDQEKKSKIGLKRARFHQGTSATLKSKYFRQSHTKRASGDYLNKGLDKLNIDAPSSSFGRRNSNNSIDSSSKPVSSSPNNLNSSEYYDEPIFFARTPSSNMISQIPTTNEFDFKFVPSDNSFMFEFEDGTVDVDTDMSASDIFSLDRSNLNQPVDEKNFQLLKSNNDFVFGFNNPSDDDSDDVNET